MLSLAEIDLDVIKVILAIYNDKRMEWPNPKTETYQTEKNDRAKDGYTVQIFFLNPCFFEE